MIQWPNELVEDIARRKSIIFLGAGVSMNSTNAAGRRPKSWNAFLTDAIVNIRPNQHIKSLIKRNDYLTACEIVKKELGREGFTTIVLDEYLTPGYIHAPIHDSIYRLDSRIVMSPNFDKIYETRANAIANGTIQVKNYYDNDVAESIRRSNRVIIKAHGSIDQTDKMIFSRTEYSNAKIENRNFYSIFEALIITNSFIFIGCGLNDPDVRLLLEDYSQKFKCARNHYFIIPKKTIHAAEMAVIENALNLKFLTYSRDNHHQELSDSLAALDTIVDLKRDELSRNMNW
ncbi:MAG TPA: SIR2 family protein [Bacteroidales bacterium]|nr:SIR2 family protein [Bacteroidales bacterium]HPS49639.1 SIR2 family protein [Bacteroidales bacterium]